MSTQGQGDVASRAIPTSLAGQGPDDWTLVPNIGAYVEADHPITCLNPTKAFEVRHVECRSGSWYVRGENTCWFNVKGVKPATQENAVAAEEAAALQSSPQPTAGGDAPTIAHGSFPDDEPERCPRCGNAWEQPDPFALADGIDRAIKKAVSAERARVIEECAKWHDEQAAVCEWAYAMGSAEAFTHRESAAALRALAQQKGF